MDSPHPSTPAMAKELTKERALAEVERINKTFANPNKTHINQEKQKKMRSRRHSLVVAFNLDRKLLDVSCCRSKKPSSLDRWLKKKHV